MAAKKKPVNPTGMNMKGDVVWNNPKPTSAFTKPGQKAKDLAPGAGKGIPKISPAKESAVGRAANQVGRVIVGASGAGAVADAVMKPTKRSIGGAAAAIATTFAAGGIAKVAAKGVTTTKAIKAAKSGENIAPVAKTVMKQIKPSTGRAIIEGTKGSAKVVSGTKRVSAQVTVTPAQQNAGKALANFNKTKSLTGNIKTGVGAAGAAYRTSTTMQSKNRKKFK